MLGNVFWLHDTRAGPRPPGAEGDATVTTTATTRALMAVMVVAFGDALADQRTFSVHEVWRGGGSGGPPGPDRPGLCRRQLQQRRWWQRRAGNRRHLNAGNGRRDGCRWKRWNVRDGRCLWQRRGGDDRHRRNVPDGRRIRHRRHIFGW